MVKGKPVGSSSGRENKPKIKRNYRKISWYQCSSSNQIPNQDNFDGYQQFLSLYRVVLNGNSTELIIYDTENKKEDVKILDAGPILDGSTSITQLPNGELFCYGSLWSGITLKIDTNYEITILQSWTFCRCSSALYFDNNIYCFGGCNNVEDLALSSKFDLKNNRWINLQRLPKADIHCHSVIYNGNILISGYLCKNLWLYLIEIDSFSIIPYDFAYARKLLINVEKLYLIEWFGNGSIYESEDEYHWKLISISGNISFCDQMYCSYNKWKIYISADDYYYQFDLKKNVLLKIK